MVRLFVGGMHYQTDALKMRQWFEQQGFEVVGEPYVVKDRQTGHSRGFGFVDLLCDEPVEQVAKELHMKKMDGKEVTVRGAHPRPAKEQRARASSPQRERQYDED